MNENLGKHITNTPGGLCSHKYNLYLADYTSSKIFKFIK